MSIATELLALQTHITNAYGAVNDKGGTIPANKNMANLSTAIASISAGGGGDIVSGEITYDALTDLGNFPNYKLEHNLGKTPKGICWFVTYSGLGTGNVSGIAKGILAYYVDENLTLALTPYTTSAGTFMYLKSNTNYNVNNMFFLDLSSSEFMMLLNSSVVGQYDNIPAGAKLRWFVWG